jgi:hypothetical protein
MNPPAAAGSQLAATPLASNAVDASGNVMALPFSWTFATSSAPVAKGMA